MSAPDERAQRIRDRARGLSKPPVPIEVEEEEGGESRTAPPQPPTPGAPEPPIAAEPAAAQPVNAANATHATVPPAPEVKRPSPPPEHPPAAAPAQPTPTPSSTTATPSTSGPRPKRKINMEINDASTLALLRALEQRLVEINETRDPKIKGQLGATLLFKMGVKLLSSLSEDELYELARSCSSYQ